MPPVVTMPARLARRPTYKGFPVPANVVVDAETGVPDFATIDVARHTEMLKQRLCELCGEHLNRWFALIGGPATYKVHLFIDGPMHEECARFAIVTCPFLARPEHGYRANVKEHPGMDSQTNEMVSNENPGVAGLAVARDYRIVRYGGALAIFVPSFRHIKWFRRGEPLPEGEVVEI